MACSTIPGRGLYYFLPCGPSIGVVYDIPRPVLYQTDAPGVKSCFLETASPRLRPLLLPLTRKNLTISPLPRPISHERCIGVRGSRVVLETFPPRLHPLCLPTTRGRTISSSRSISNSCRTGVKRVISRNISSSCLHPILSMARGRTVSSLPSYIKLLNRVYRVV